MPESRFFIFSLFYSVGEDFRFRLQRGKEGKQEEENNLKSKTAEVLDHDNGIQRKREKRTRERERDHAALVDALP